MQTFSSLLEMSNDPVKYLMSFTTGGLLLKESSLVVEIYDRLRNWGAVQDEVLAGNLFQSRTVNTAKRHCREVISRLETLSEDELQWLYRHPEDEQALMLWVAVCRRYSFIGEFATEVVRERYLSLRNQLSKDDYDAFFNQKAQWHDALDRITESTRKKQRQIVFQMMRQAGLLTDQDTLIPAMLPSDFVELLRRSDPSDIYFFPIFDSDLPTL